MIFTLFFVLQLVFSSEYIILDLEGTSNKKEPAQAKQEIFDTLVEKLSFENIETILGEEETKRKEKDIKQKVLTKYGIYIPYITQGNLNRSRYPYSMKVTMHFSRKALREVLLKEGLLNFSNENIKILPIISFLDKKYSKSYKWWFIDNNYKKTLVYQQALDFQEILKKEMWKDSFQVLNPIEGDFHNFIPKNLRNITYSSSELQSLGANLNSELLIYGSLQYGPSPKNSLAVEMEIDLEAIIASSGRQIASLKNKVESSAGDYEKNVKDLASDFYQKSVEQMKISIVDAWKKGLFDTDRIRMKVYADLSHKDFLDFTAYIQQNSIKIKNLRSRTFAPNHLVLEADVSQGLEAFVNDLKKMRWKGKSFKVWKSGDKEIRLEI